MFVDSHVHLHFPDFDTDRSDVIERAREAGIHSFINIGTDAEGSRQSLDLAKTYPFIWATAGIHPHDAHLATEEDFTRIQKILDDPRTMAIGEVGLDFFRGHSPRERQSAVFRRFLAMHRRIQKPLVIHCRDAYREMEEILKHDLKPPLHGVMHCFSSDKETMFRFLDLGFYISFAGPLTYKKNDSLREACTACPSDRMLFETDAPFLPPQSIRGKRNESMNLLETAGTASRLHGVSMEQMGEITSANSRRLFKISPHPALSPGRGEGRKG